LPEDSEMNSDETNFLKELMISIVD